jgi:hypothetical protein
MASADLSERTGEPREGREARGLHGQSERFHSFFPSAYMAASTLLSGCALSIA